ncbi:polypeptide N-acetylgalactosaminyltransferase 13-like [Saccoglossus kowalevskii]|uniref:Polypeptide N-acetylgalactosaminyltransferase n=1 Tax=Saccoglossus kowalevskii TaxID=10224 RepID=A0A1C9TA72_SACKO|nr:PREDICTED: polypeptide N-acetylgalactosaminyltransferase 1-like [Saccoglossus kowalevskii]AOR07040.1 polypeptide N-acetylgalactosaminyltransferase 1-like protein [Saccoglossus kowalevskii]
MAIFRRGRASYVLLLCVAMMLSMTLNLRLLLNSPNTEQFDTEESPFKNKNPRWQNRAVLMPPGKENPGETMPAADAMDRQHYLDIHHGMANITATPLRVGPGEMGKAVTVAKSEEEEMEKMFKVNYFNLMISNRISNDRSLADYRPQGCFAKKYSRNLPKTSVILVYHNEAWSVLMRTVHSVINRSPRHLLEEILLIDDASTREYLGRPLDDYITKLPVPVRVHHAKERRGLIGARLKGAELAKAPVLTFLDSHCECSKGWLEPLLDRIAANRSTVVCPVINQIDDRSFAFVNATEVSHIGGFDWNIIFNWYNIPQSEKDRIGGDKSEPVRSPTMAGGLFSIDKSYFEELGSYDPEFEFWGGENIELSLKIWMCGGILEFVPCSHVGHVFRKHNPHKYKNTTYNVVGRNNRRLAEVWLDEYKYLFYANQPETMKIDPGDISQRVQLRKNLQCKSFRWFLQNIYPDSHYNFAFVGVGQLKNVASGACLDFGKAAGHGGKEFKGKDATNVTSNTVELWPCHDGKIQLFIRTDKKEFRYIHMCLDYNVQFSFPFLYECHGQGANQQWIHDLKTQALHHSSSRLCMDLPVPGSMVPTMKECSGAPSQQWEFAIRYPGNISPDEVS